MPADGTYAFEDIDDSLSLLPLAARRVLDALGVKLSLEGWLSLAPEQRRALVAAGQRDGVDRDVAARLLEGARPPAATLAALPEADAARVPAALQAALGGDRPLDDARWAALGALDRYVLAKYAGKPEKLARAYDEIARVRFSHLTRAGAAHMVDVGGKDATARRAVASACVQTTPAVVAAIGAGTLAKGEVLATARVAGILAAKRTPELIPHCHPVQTTRVTIDFEADAAGALRVVAAAEAIDRTGVEMEAMVAASVAALTVYDMIKSADRWARIDGVRLERKSGGKSGDLVRPEGR